MTQTTADDDAASARAAEQARLRKERREAKIRAGGASRLNKISGLGGGVQRDPPPPAASAPAPATKVTKPMASPEAHADPEEVFISDHFYQPQTTARIPPVGGPGDNLSSEAQLQQMMMGFEGSPGVGGGGMPGAGGLGNGIDEDPMMKMMMQIMGGGGPGGMGGDMPFPFPPPKAGGGANPFANMAGFPGMPGEQQQVLPDRYASLWRLLHTAVALGLGLYIALWTTFSGTKLERDRRTVTKALGDDGVEVQAHESAMKLFWAFATAEAVLLTTRFFMDRGRRALPAGSGVLGMAMGFIPQPFKGYLDIALRYGQIFSTVKADILVCLFVLGACSWVRS
ncbi:hypothetical protein B0H63DRAFT_469556 [Podospora didyma]|uniref:Golgi to ER traffic protein 2 n=1 Tax=Podospora didyma TaxID=330526 RepID=A0AAE0NTJ0_9PEZI|nr:hypothetical protein B0H63DRAFT_469556 [Podospora didyma]